MVFNGVIHHLTDSAPVYRWTRHFIGMTAALFLNIVTLHAQMPSGAMTEPPMSPAMTDSVVTDNATSEATFEAEETSTVNCSSYVGRKWCLYSNPTFTKRAGTWAEGKTGSCGVTVTYKAGKLAWLEGKMCPAGCQMREAWVDNSGYHNQEADFTCPGRREILWFPRECNKVTNLEVLIPDFYSTSTSCSPADVGMVQEPSIQCESKAMAVQISSYLVGQFNSLSYYLPRHYNQKLLWEPPTDKKVGWMNIDLVSKCCADPDCNEARRWMGMCDAKTLDNFKIISQTWKIVSPNAPLMTKDDLEKHWKEAELDYFACMAMQQN